MLLANVGRPTSLAWPSKPANSYLTRNVNLLLQDIIDYYYYWIGARPRARRPTCTQHPARPGPAPKTHRRRPQGSRGRAARRRWLANKHQPAPPLLSPPQTLPPAAASTAAAAAAAASAQQTTTTTSQQPIFTTRRRHHQRRCQLLPPPPARQDTHCTTNPNHQTTPANSCCWPPGQRQPSRQTDRPTLCPAHHQPSTLLHAAGGSHRPPSSNNINSQFHQLTRLKAFQAPDS